MREENDDAQEIITPEQTQQVEDATKGEEMEEGIYTPQDATLTDKSQPAEDERELRLEPWPLDGSTVIRRKDTALNLRCPLINQEEE